MSAGEVVERLFIREDVGIHEPEFKTVQLALHANGSVSWLRIGGRGGRGPLTPTATRTARARPPAPVEAAAPSPKIIPGDLRAFAGVMVAATTSLGMAVLGERDLFFAFALLALVNILLWSLFGHPWRGGK